jgi:hypothetical protein
MYMQMTVQLCFPINIGKELDHVVSGLSKTTRLLYSLVKLDAFFLGQDEN